MSTPLTLFIARRIKSDFPEIRPTPETLSQVIESAIAEHEKANGPVMPADSSAQDAEDRALQSYPAQCEKCGTVFCALDLSDVCPTCRVAAPLCKHCGRPSTHHSTSGYCDFNNKLNRNRFTPDEPQYRMLEAGEQIEAGDEYLNAGEWRELHGHHGAVGMTIRPIGNNCAFGHYRRKITPATQQP